MCETFLFNANIDSEKYLLSALSNLLLIFLIDFLGLRFDGHVVMKIDQCWR